MKSIKLFGKEIIAWGSEKEALAPPISYKIQPKNLPAKRVSQPSIAQQVFLNEGDDHIITPSFFLQVIPAIRKLAYTNPDISQALNNIVELGNTGHQIKFDAAVTEEQINKMRAHLDRKKKEWSESNAGMDGLVNKMISQVIISGALSNEWVPNISLTGIKTVALINPEFIRWGYNVITQTYEPFQYIQGLVVPNNSVNNLIRLNPNTFKYYALNGDTDEPYGIPPYLPALDSIRTQKLMMDNIKFIIEQVGVMGFLQVLIGKPDQLPDESYDNYKTRLETFLTDARKRVQEGYRDGLSVGYKDDTEFDFHSTTRNFGGVSEFFQLNELLVSSGLKMDASMLGRNYGTSETQITVIFTKLISQLKNIQALIKCNLEYGYALELRLAGFNFNVLHVEFNPSTALDELKAQQADEIKIRNQNALYLDGIISQEQYAHNMGYETPNQPEPRFIRGNVQTEAEINQKVQDGKNASDVKVRSKNRPVEKTLK